MLDLLNDQEEMAMDVLGDSGRGEPAFWVTMMREGRGKEDMQHLKGSGKEGSMSACLDILCITEE